MIAVLSHYPVDVIRAVVDPVDGLPSRLEWLPTIKEIKEACEGIIGPRRRAAEYEARTHRQLEERALLEAPRDGRPTADEMQERYGVILRKSGIPLDPADIGLTPEQRRKKYWDQGKAPP